jgi:hypothetical protein
VVSYPALPARLLGCCSKSWALPEAQVCRLRRTRGNASRFMAGCESDSFHIPCSPMRAVSSLLFLDMWPCSTSKNIAGSKLLFAASVRICTRYNRDN